MGKDSFSKNKKNSQKGQKSKPGIGRSLKEALAHSKGTTGQPGKAAAVAVSEKKKPPFDKSKRGGGKNSAPYKDRGAGDKGGRGGKPSQPQYKPRPNVALVTGMKGNWNKIRDRSTATGDRGKLLARMVEQMKGHVLQVTLRHDASRMVQSIMQFGSAEQREQMFGELVQKTYEIAKTPYGHFAVLKAVTYCNKEADQKRLVQSLKGHFVSLGTNVIGARTVESVLQLYPAALCRPLKSEFYGQKFTLLLPTSTAGSLRELLAAVPAHKASSVLDHMRDLVAKFVHKGLLTFSYVHSLVWEYAQEVAVQAELAAQTGPNSEGQVEGASATRMQDLVAQLAESTGKLLSTKAGARTVCLVVTHASAKDRKRILKTLKGHALESLLHEAAHLGIMRLVDVTDDTVNVQKMLFDELKHIDSKAAYTADGTLKEQELPPLLSIALSPYGSKMLLRLLAPHKQHLEPDEEGLFKSSESSKKSPALLRKEHLTYLRGPLTQVCARFAEPLMRSRSGSKVLVEVARVFRSANVFDAVARVSVGLEPVVGKGPDAAGNKDSGPMDSDEEEDEEEEDEEEEDEAEEEEEAEEDEEEEEDVGETGQVEVDDEMKDMLDAMESGGVDTKAKKPTAVIEVRPLLKIEEDPIAHGVMKKMIKIGSEEVPEGEEDQSLWADQDADDTFASHLAEYLSSNTEEDGSSTLEKWLAVNRPCFVIAELLRADSSKAATLIRLQAHQDAVAAAAKAHKGGEAVLHEISALKGGNASKKRKSLKK